MLAARIRRIGGVLRRVDDGVGAAGGGQRAPAREKSLAITVRTPCALSMQITARPMGPQPITIATSRLLTSPRRTACQPTAIGSVSAAISGGRPLGTGNVSDCSTSSCSA
ncbi:zinc-binding dehydrogenase domain protein [Mycobacterium kansasii 732]|nr:zinc-binding dehydrogenase domain protein [Mycobacterium kansasii 732]